MNKKNAISLTIVIIFLLAAVAACIPQTQTKEATSTVTRTEIPPKPTQSIIPPTTAPTSTSTQPPDSVFLLLTTDEIKDNFEYGPNRMIEGLKNGYHYYEINYFNSEKGATLNNTIIFATEPWNDVPNDAFQLASGYQVGQAGTTIDAPALGDRSIVYTLTQNRYDTGLVFTKGRTLVTIATVGINLDTLIKYGKLIEQKLSNTIPEPSPIFLSEKVDESLLTNYFTSVELSTNKADQKAAFQTSDQICPNFNNVEGVYEQPDPAFGIYDIKNNLYIYKYTPVFGFQTGRLYCYIPDTTGQFELRVEIGGAVIKSIPFDVN